MIDKKGERYLVYMHVFIKEFMFMHICFVLQIGEKDFVILCLISMFTPTFAYMFMCLIAYLFCLFGMHELRGSFFGTLL